MHTAFVGLQGKWKMFARELEDVCELEEDRDIYVLEININR